MSDRGFVPHVENNVRMRGAPGMEFGMESSRALRDAGNNLADGLGGLGRGILAVGGAMREFVERKVDTQNKLMATQTDNLYLAIQEELNNRMASNPASYKDFPKWADEADQRFLDESRQYTEQMTTDFRELYYARKEHDRIQDLSRRQMIATQAEVTNQYNMMQTQLKSAAEQGKADDYKAILEAHKGVLISEDEYNLRMQEYPKLADSAAAKRLVDAAADSDSSVQAKAALEQLKERDSDGNFVNFKNLTEDYRDQLIRAAETQKNKAELESDQEFLAALYQGEIPTEEMLVHAKNDGLISTEQFNKRLSWVRQFLSSADSEAKMVAAAEKQAQKEFEAQREAWFEASLHMAAPKYKDQSELDTAFKAGELNVDEYNKYSDMLARYNSNLERAKEQAAEAARKTAAQIETDMRDSFKWDIYTKNYPMQPEKAYAEAKKDWAVIQKKVKNPKLLLELSEFLNKKISDTLSNTEDEFKTPEGKDVLNFIEVSYWDDKESQYKGLVYDQGGWFSRDGANSQEHQRAQFYNLLEIARGKLQAGESAEKIKEYVKKQVGEMNRGKIRDVLNSAYDPQTSRQTGHTPDMWNHLGVSF